MTNKEAYEILEKYIRCSNNECPPVDCDECQDHVTAKQLDDALQVALDALQEPKKSDHIDGVSKKDISSVQPEQNDAEFWHRRSDEYEKMFFDLYWRMMNGVKFESMQFDENGITLKMKEPSREDNT